MRAGTRYAPAVSTWYLAHPVFSLTVMPFFAFFSPWVSYVLFVGFSLGLIGYGAFLFSKKAQTANQQATYYALFFLSFPVYWMLFVGNMHAILVLSVALILLALYELAFEERETTQRTLMIGLLLSLFSKPLVLLLLPALLVVRETRRVVAMVYLLRCRGFFTHPQAITLLGVGLFFYLPSLYCLASSLQSNQTEYVLMILADRVIPVVLLFCLLGGYTIQFIKASLVLMVDRQKQQDFA